jgi:hypothetical protein
VTARRRRGGWFHQRTPFRPAPPAPPPIRPAVPFATLCLIARDLLRADRTVGETDWKEAIKVAVVAQGFRSPWSDQCARAMAWVERREEAWGTPRVPAPPPPPPAPRPERPDPTRLPRSRASLRVDPFWSPWGTWPGRR